MQHADRYIRVVYYVSSDRLAAREEIFLCGKSHEGTDGIFDKLLRVSSLTENDLYDFDTHVPPLGTGELLSTPWTAFLP